MKTKASVTISTCLERNLFNPLQNVTQVNVLCVENFWDFTSSNEMIDSKQYRGDKSSEG